MKTRLRTVAIGATTLLGLILASPCVGAQNEASPSPREGAVAVAKLIASAAKRTGKKFIVDPRVQGEATLIGQEPTSIDYDALLLILRVHGFVAVEEGGYVRIIPDANIRQQPLPVVTGKESHADGEYVNKIIVLKSAPAAHLVPILRPLLPQHAHLVALPCKNTLVVTDTFASVRRIEQLARALDVGDPYAAPSCSAEWSLK